MPSGRILVVEDLPDVRATLSGLLSDIGYEVHSVSSRTEALQLIDTELFHVAVLDVRLDESDEDNRDGLLLMHEIRQKRPSTAVIILTGHSTVEMVQEALQPDRDGKSVAFGFLQKFEFGRLPEYVELAIEHVSHNDGITIGELIAMGENERLEFKASTRWDYANQAVNKSIGEAIAVTIAGMLNGKGGNLLIGVADDGAVLGIENDIQTLRKRNLDGFQLTLADIVKTYLGVEHVPYLKIRFELVDDKHVCVVVIEKSPKPVFLTSRDVHKFFVRIGNSTRSLDVKETLNYTQANWKGG